MATIWCCPNRIQNVSINFSNLGCNYCAFYNSPVVWTIQIVVGARNGTPAFPSSVNDILSRHIRSVLFLIQLFTQRNCIIFVYLVFFFCLPIWLLLSLDAAHSGNVRGAGNDQNNGQKLYLRVFLNFNENRSAGTSLLRDKKKLAICSLDRCVWIGLYIHLQM